MPDALLFRQKNRKNIWPFKKNVVTLQRFRRERALSSAGSERLPYKQRVGGSNPSAPTKFSHFSHEGRLAQLVQSVCLTSRGSGVRIPQRPHQNPIPVATSLATVFLFIYTHGVGWRSLRGRGTLFYEYTQKRMRNVNRSLAISHSPLSSGGADETRTRDPLRDRQVF